jgi:Ca2+-binding RTX toxin-like protein
VCRWWFSNDCRGNSIADVRKINPGTSAEGIPLEDHHQAAREPNMAQFTSFGAFNASTGWLFVNPASGDPGAYNLAASNSHPSTSAGAAIFDYADGTRTVLHGTGFSKTPFGLSWTTLTSAEHTDSTGAVTYETITGIGAAAASAVQSNYIYATVMTGANTFTGSGNADYLAASLDPGNGGSVAQPDTFFGGGGADYFRGGGGDDIFRYTAGTDAVAGEVIGGESGIDTVRLENAGDINFIDVNIQAEVLQFFSGTSTATFKTTQFFLGAAPKTFTGSAGVDALVLVLDADHIDLSSFTFNNWTAGQDTITITHTFGFNSAMTGTGQNDTFRLSSGSQGLFQGALGDDTFVLPAITAGAITIDGGDGLDTAVYTAKTAAVVVTLNGATNAIVTVNGVATETIRNVENVAGGSGADTLTGDGLANVLTGDAGNDTLDGGGGSDTAVYSGNRAQYAVAYNVATQTVTLTDTRGGAPDGIDTITNIESFRFADGTFTLAQLNSAPTAVGLSNTTASLAANTPTTTPIKVADIAVTDDGLGTNTLGLTGADAAFFEIVGTELFLKAGTVFDFATKPSYAVAVTADDTAVGATPDATSSTYILNLTNGPPAPEVKVTGLSNIDIADGDTAPDAGDGTAIGNVVVGQVVERTFTVSNTGTAALTTKTLKLPAGFKLAPGETLNPTIAPGTSDTFKIILDTKKVGTFGGVVSFLTNDASEATFDFTLSANVVAPEIDVSGNGSNILDNDKLPGAADHTDFGSSSFGSAGTIRNFTINNTGGGPLSISNVTVPAGFTLIGAFPSSILANSSATIQVQLDTNATGAKQGDIVITNNDSTEAVFNFTVKGLVTPPAVAVGDDPNAAHAQANAETFIGTAGLNTVSYDGATAGVVASLLAPLKNTGFAAGDTYNAIENLRGSSFNDTLTGNTGNNVLEGGGGADKLDGGTGIDTASYANAGAGVTADMLKATNNFGEAAGDTYKNIENLLGSAHNDTLFGNTLANAIDGGAGNDTIAGNGGVDTLTGGLGGDTFRFNATKDGGGTTGDIFIDFVSGEDHIGILRTGFKIATTVIDAVFETDYFVSGTGVAPTPLNPSGVAATLSGHGQFLFNQATDQLWWDEDGTGAKKAILLATFQNGAHVQASDFDLY